MHLTRPKTYRFLELTGAWGVAMALVTFGLSAALPFSVTIIAILSIVPFVASYVVGSNGRRFPPAPRLSGRHRLFARLGTLGLLLSLLACFASLAGFLPDVAGLWALGTIWIWVVVLCVGLVGTITAEESEQSLDQVLAMIWAGSGS